MLYFLYKFINNDSQNFEIHNLDLTLGIRDFGLNRAINLGLGFSNITII